MIRTLTNRLEQLEGMIVTASQMREIESRLFAAGMPVAALMEKVGNLIAQRIEEYYPHAEFRTVGMLVGPGYNGGDALVAARELHLKGYDVRLYRPIAKSKELTENYARYVEYLGLQFCESVEQLRICDFLIDGLFGFGLDRAPGSPISDVIQQVNQWSQPIVSIDVPSGLDTNTGEALGITIQADRTFCIGLWKLGLLQDQALQFVGQAELIDCGVPLAEVQAVLDGSASLQRSTRKTAIAHLPLARPRSTYKYKVGSLLLICGSHRYSGGAILTALGARASGIGMLYIAVPESLQMLLSAHLPEALILPCPETKSGAIAQILNGTDLSEYDAIACGPGLTTDAKPVVQQVLQSDRPLVLDADGLNILAHLETVPTLLKRQAPTVLTPHVGEFKRLFPDLTEQMSDRTKAVRTAAEQTQAIVLLKGARTMVASPNGSVWINSESTPALARGGSGDVLTGLIGGLVAQGALKQSPVDKIVQSAVWWPLMPESWQLRSAQS